MLIIVEGPDGVGKSTYVDRLTEHLTREHGHNRVAVLHAGPPKSNTPWEEYVDPLLNYRPGRGEHVICDRWHLGEFAYPYAGRRGGRSLYDVYPGSFYWVDAFLRSRGALVVRLDERGWTRDYLAGLDDESDAWALGHMGQLRVGFEVACSLLTTLPVLHDRDKKLTFDYVLDQAELVERSASILNDFVTYVGPVRPSIVLFGDVRNDVSDDRVPAFRPGHGTSGGWLYAAIRKLHYDREWWRDVGIANACDVDDPVALLKTLTSSYNRSPAVVALGNRAHAALRAVEHGAVTHPQYASRFHHRCKTWYVGVLQQAYTQRTDERAQRPTPGDEDWED